ncbi:MAG TPA: EAL domain-containing protein [Burkholderiales bacterium]|nr:EAL domain-containing protein [Burkholderiales bacterium]
MSDTSAAGADKANILIVDDRPGNLLALEATLAELGQNIVTAGSGVEALKRLLEREYAVVLLDVNMADMDGFETAGYIRGSQRTAHTPIIFLTAYAEAMEAARGYSLGAVDCIVTPVIPEILRTKVHVFVKLYLMTQEAKLRQAQRITQEATQMAIEALPNPIFFTGPDGRYRGVNKAWETFFGISRAAALGKTAEQLFPHDAELARTVAAVDSALLDTPGSQTYEGAITSRDGAHHDVVYFKATYAGPDAPVAGVIATIVDITERKRAEKRQAMEHAVTRVLAESSSVEQAIPAVIETICTSLGWDYGAYWRRDVKAGLLVRRESWGIDTPGIRTFDAVQAQRMAQPDPTAQGLMRRAFAIGKPVWLSDLSKEPGFQRQGLAEAAGLNAAFAFPLCQGDEVLGVMEFFHRDVREPDAMLVKIAQSIASEIAQYIVRMQAEEAVKFMAMHDGLTGLPNRVMFDQRLAGAIAHARRHNRAAAVLFVDLDKFKVINDTLGHEAGDQVLREAAQRLTDHLRAGDTVARLGGDEFVILLEEVTDPLYVGSVTHKLIEALAAPFVIGGREYRVTASIGVSAFPDDGQDAPTLLKNADIAMYRAKQSGRNAFAFFSAHITAGSLERLSLEAGLRRALDNDEELTLYYQPQVEACTGRIVGMEALVRWQHPELGLLEPSRFIKLAEETGLIVPLGEWVLHKACRAHRKWQKMHLHLGRMAVNLSPRQFLHTGLLADTLRVLEATGCSGKFIELEITESMVMHDPDGAVALIRQIKDLGVRIAIDDFGTGYSSLAYLRRFPIDSLKVDRSFVADVPNDAGNVAITQAIIAMARTLQLTVIAEGVETVGQFNFLRSRGCDEVQGYYFSPPVPFDEATALLELSLGDAGSAPRLIARGSVIR